jgi:hypothetical protein
MDESKSDYQALLGIGIPKSYASEIASGKRQPSLRKALDIYRKCGLKFGPLKNARERDIPAIERTMCP